MKNRVSPDKCPLCGGAKKEGKTTFTVDLGFGVVVVRDVPATVCSQHRSTDKNEKIWRRLVTGMADRKGHSITKILHFLES